MANKTRRKSAKKRPARKKPAKQRQTHGGVLFLGILGFILLLLYLSAKVQVEEVLRESSQLKQDLREEDLAMQAVFVSAPGGSELDNERYLRALEEVPGVTRVEGRAVQPLSWKLPAADEFEDAFILAAWEPFEGIEIQPMRVVGDGRYPVVGQQEIAVEKRMAERHGLSVGDQVVLRAAGGDAEGAPWTITQPSAQLFCANVSRSGSIQARNDTNPA